MRILWRTAAVTLVVLGLALTGLVLLAPRVVDLPSLREAIEKTARRELGRAVDYEKLSLSFLPPGVLVEVPRIAGETAADPPLLEARSLRLELALLPLFTGRVLLDSLRVDGAVVTLVRSEGGIALPGRSPGPAERGATKAPRAREAPPEPGAAVEQTGGVSLAVGRVALRDAKLVIVDRTLEPAFRWSLDRIDLRARARRSAGPIEIEAEAHAEGGGRLRAVGEATLAGEWTLHLRLDDLSPSPAVAYVAQISTLSGRLAGDVELHVGANSGRPRVEAHLKVSDWLVEARNGLSQTGELDLRLGTRPQGEPSFQLALSLLEGGRVGIDGYLVDRGRLDARVAFEALPLELLRPLLGPEARLAGQIAGAVDWRGSPSVPEKLALHASLAAQHVGFSDFELVGPVDLEAKLAGDPSRPRADFRIELSRSQWALGDSFRKPEGVKASLSGQLRSDASDGAAKRSYRLIVQRFELLDLVARMEFDPSPSSGRIGIAAPAFDLAGWQALLPPLEGWQPSGLLALEQISVRLEPLEISGRVIARDLRLRSPGGHEFALRGALEGHGSALRLSDVVLDAPGGALAVSGALDLEREAWPFELRTESRGALRAHPLMLALAPSAGILHGPLVFGSQIRGRLRAENSVPRGPIDSLVGEAHFAVGRGASGGAEGGRLDGVSVLRSLFTGRGGRAALAPLMAALSLGAGSLDRFYSEDFERMEGHFQLADGRLETDDLRLVYPGYGVSLKGKLELADLALDMRGRVDLGAGVLRVLGAADRDAALSIPLAHVGGHLTEPEFGFAPAAVRELTQHVLLSGAVLGRVDRALDTLLPGSSKLLESGLGALLGGGSKSGKGVSKTGTGSGDQGKTDR